MAKGEEAFELVTCVDGVRRPRWAAADPVLHAYYDDEWGAPVHGDDHVFERISLEVFQSGLSWATILRKRPAFRRAFAEFHIPTLATWGEAERTRLLADPGIIRNARKVDAVLTNARAALSLSDDGGLSALVWRYALTPQEADYPVGIAGDMLGVPRETAESAALAAELKRRGFTMVGSVNLCAAMCAIGVIPVRAGR